MLCTSRWIAFVGVGVFFPSRTEGLNQGEPPYHPCAKETAFIKSQDNKSDAAVDGNAACRGSGGGHKIKIVNPLAQSL